MNRGTSGTDSARNRRNQRELGDRGRYVEASFTLLAGAIDSLQSFVTVFIAVYTLMIFAYVILSWVRSPYSAHPVVRFLHDVCDPYLRLFRRFLPPLGPWTFRRSWQ